MNKADAFYRGVTADIGRAIQTSDDAALSDLVDDFSAQIIRERPFPERVRDILDALKGGKQFHSLCRAADALLDAGVDQPYVHLLYSQGMIELGQLNQAQERLEGLRKGLSPSQKWERSEVCGLLGRVHKQRFVKLQEEDRQRAARELTNSIACYNEVYDDDPAWHGANLVALLRRAEKDTIAHGFSVKSELMAQDVLNRLGQVPESKRNHWTNAVLGEVSLALEDWQTAGMYYGQFANHRQTDSFALASAARNLKEIWNISLDDGDPAANILLALEAKTLTLGRGSTGEVGVATADVFATVSALQGAISRQDNTLQAILGTNGQVPLLVMLSLINSSQAVCQVVNRYRYEMGGRSGGTGFILAGGLFGERWRGRAILVTNNHVLSEHGGSIGVRRADGDAVFHFLGGIPGKRAFRIQSLLWESPVEELDVTLAILEGDQDIPDGVVDRLTINCDNGVLGQSGQGNAARVYLIGHPGGRGLEFSLSDNCLIDHDLLDEEVERSYRRIHYGAPTVQGMSGSPVLYEDRLEVVGLHRAGGDIPPLRSSVKPQGYKANEGVWIASIRETAAHES